jgi:hypothetical protein
MPAEAATTRPAIDFSRPFLPARLTTLAHAPSWKSLETRHQLRYTQLYALYLNEQTVFFEELLATNVLPALYQRPDRIGEELAEDLRRFEAEERRHSSWFREINRRGDPDRFSLDEGTYVFIPADARMRAVTAWFARRPFAFPCWIWLMLLQEERSISVARECLAKDSGLEPEFVALHRKHMADEVDHVHWDIKLVEQVWLPLPMWKRRLQTRIFGVMMAEFFTAPKRSLKTSADTCSPTNAHERGFSTSRPAEPRDRRGAGSRAAGFVSRGGFRRFTMGARRTGRGIRAGDELDLRDAA